MNSVATVVQQTAWLYTRGDASVHMSLDDQVSPPVLVIRGPGVAVATYDFPDLAELRAFAREQEKRLQDEGFHLAASAERRAGRERRQTPRLGVIDRRQHEQ